MKKLVALILTGCLLLSMAGGALAAEAVVQCDHTQFGLAQPIPHLHIIQSKISISIIR